MGQNHFSFARGQTPGWIEVPKTPSAIAAPATTTRTPVLIQRRVLWRISTSSPRILSSRRGPNDVLGEVESTVDVCWQIFAISSSPPSPGKGKNGGTLLEWRLFPLMSARPARGRDKGRVAEQGSVAILWYCPNWCQDRSLQKPVTNISLYDRRTWSVKTIHSN